MSLMELLNDDMKQAMKEKDKEVLSVIRMVKAAIQLDQINKQRELSDEEIIDIIIKQVKLRNDAIVEFKKGSRLDLVAQNEQEIKLLNKYLPEQLTDEELTIIIEEAIDIVKATSSNDIGKIMKEVLPKVKGKCDLSKVNIIIKGKLT